MKNHINYSKNIEVLVVGSGLAAYGACLGLLKNKTVSITVIDIGLHKAYPGQPNQPIPNAIAYDDSFFPYGVNDTRCPVFLNSMRMCSSHAIGGYSKVYSGSILKPKDDDLIGWPNEGKPTINDYNDVLSSLRIWQLKDNLNDAFPVYPITYEPVITNTTYFGAPRIALAKGSPYDTPFDSTYDFQQWERQGKILYLNDHYVVDFMRIGDKIHVTTVSDKQTKILVFDQVYLGAGCINTTAIVDRSVHGVGTRAYTIKSAKALLQLYLQLPILLIPTTVTDPRRRVTNPDLCKLFVEHRSNRTNDLWSHTQVNSFNSTILATIHQKLPPLIREVVLAINKLLRFSITAFHSDLGIDSTLISTIKDSEFRNECQSIHVIEPNDLSNRSLAITIKWAILKNFFSLGLLPLPFGQLIADILRGNRLGGWHYGGTLPMSDTPSNAAYLKANGELYGVKGVYVVDASGFPSIPGSTIALLTMANAYRIAKRSIANPSDK